MEIVKLSNWRGEAVEKRRNVLGSEDSNAFTCSFLEPASDEQMTSRDIQRSGYISASSLCGSLDIVVTRM